ncbi:PAS domain S-box protein [Aestuariibacter sp. GS-14]|uniref:MHYT domain-containing protein n=1 Tax=Aestuariibacter sp. GS-14 TaxID=2590670 RepID=UPI00112EF489|nr:MHYT domain-containing protein [Aestuariibacter sp. GS-14]TPV60905.1 PAS domain S-box protein [Aestuariibacter sp. GS-14]
MNNILSLFNIPESSLVLTGEYEPFLVLVSISIAVFASFMGFQVATQASSAGTPMAKRLLLMVGAIAQGVGIWSMHFVGMLAFELCTSVSYDWHITLISMFPGIGAAWVALRFLTTNTIAPLQIALGGVLVGAGIGAMHYIGMAAMEMAPLLKYDSAIFALSIVVAVLLAMLSLWVRNGLHKIIRTRLSNTNVNILAGIVMGFAISGMHYTGMAAARFVSPPGLKLVPQDSEVSVFMAAVITFIATMVIALVLGISLLAKYKDITKIANANEKRLTGLMDSAVEGVLTVNSKGIVISANPSVTRILGWKREQLIGEDVTKIVPENRRHLYSKNFFSHVQEPKNEKLIGSSRDVLALDVNLRPIPVRVSLSHTEIDNEPFFILFLSDIRERLAMEKAVKDNEEKFRSLIANIPGIAYRCLNDTTWPMVFISNAVEKITGYSAKDFLLPEPKISFSDLFHPDDIPLIEAAIADQQEYTMEYRIIARDGYTRWLREHGRFIRNDNNEIVWLDGFIMDITDRRKMENELVVAKDVAEQAAASRAAFLANMSHEIRTPMNAVIGFSDILLDTPLNTEQHKHVSTINRSARSLLHLLNDILDSAKLDKGKLELEYNDFILSDEIDTVISTFWLEAKRKGLDLQVDLSGDLASAYNGAPERVRQVLNNLVGNAVKFTERGSVSLVVKPAETGGVRFVISDTGIGMSAAQVTKVFDAFAQADASMSRKFGGTGLGTTISKQLVELMGGTIEVTSEIDTGTQFVFTLPLKPVESAQQIKRLQAMVLPSLDVLIVDDIEQNIDLLKLLLERAGHNVTVAQDGQQALQRMAEQQFDVVLMDLQMPVMDGLTAASQRREFERQNGLKPTPIIALTASVLAQDKKSASDAGMEGFANKPIDFPLLCNEIARVLGIQGSALATKAEPADAALIDWSRGESLWGSQIKLIHEIKRFQADFANERAHFDELINNQDYIGLRSLAHRFKGVSGNLGLIQFMQTCKILESANNDDADLKTALARLLVISDEVNQAISHEQESAAEHASQVNLQELKSVLCQLLDGVKHNRVDETELVALAAFKQSQYASEIQAILDAIDDFEFEQAITLLCELIEKLNG